MSWSGKDVDKDGSNSSHTMPESSNVTGRFFDPDEACVSDDASGTNDLSGTVTTPGMKEGADVVSAKRDANFGGGG